MPALLVLTGCQQLPQQKWNQLQFLRAQLLRVQAERYCSEKFRILEAEFEQSRLQFARASSQIALFRQVRDLELGLDRILGQASHLLTEVEKLQQGLGQDQQDQLEVIQSSMSAIGSSTLDPELRRQVAQIEIKLDQARTFWERKDYLRCAEILDQMAGLSVGLEAQVEKVNQRYQDPALLRMWRKWGRETVQWSVAQGKAALVVDKYQHRARLYQNGRLLEELEVDLGWNGLVDKVKQGDGATPEGKYTVKKKKEAGETRFFRALLLDYPHWLDRREFTRAKRSGRIEAEARIGGLIEVHGEGGRGRDWTEGCVALKNSDMQRLFDLAYPGMPVTVIGKWIE